MDRVPTVIRGDVGVALVRFRVNRRRIHGDEGLLGPDNSPVFADVRRGADLDSYRQFANAENPGTGHLLLRPLGQMIVAEALGITVGSKTSKPVPTMKDLFEKLATFGPTAAEENVHLMTSIWHNITYNPARGTMNMESQNGCTALRHLLGGLTRRTQHP